MAALTVFFDASVLYPAPLRNLLMRLALTGLFRARWSARVHEEWIEALLRNRPDLERQKLERTRQLMDAHAQDALVEGFEPLIEGIELPDPNDRHVVAAAVRGQADVIVTRNLKDFPVARLRSLGLEPMHPDAFVLQLLELSPGAVVAAVREHRASLCNPPKAAADYLETLERQGLVHVVAGLRGYVDVI